MSNCTLFLETIIDSMFFFQICAVSNDSNTEILLLITRVFNRYTLKIVKIISY
jgi:hypothetical protein